MNIAYIVLSAILSRGEKQEPGNLGIIKTDIPLSGSPLYSPGFNEALNNIRLRDIGGKTVPLVHVLFRLIYSAVQVSAVRGSGDGGL